MRFFILALLLTGCAKRTYLTAGEMVGGAGNKDQALQQCLVRFASGVCVSMAWEKFPTEQEVGSFIFKTFRPNAADGSPVEVDLSGTMAVVLWMPSMGHGSAPVSVERVDVGTFRATNASFFMKGVWEIRIQLKDGANVQDQAVLPFTL